MGFLGGRNYKPAESRDTAGIDEPDVSNVSEARPVPYVAGTRKLAVTWIGRVYRQFNKRAKDERPGKK
jgi:hypothetical protein